MPGRSALPAAMIAQLTSGWQASATVDADLAKWAASEAGHCKKNDLKNPAYASSLPFDSKATNGKTAFVKQWNGLARQYGLRPTSRPKIYEQRAALTSADARAGRRSTDSAGGARRPAGRMLDR